VRPPQSVLDAENDALQLRLGLVEFELAMVHGLIPAGTENSELAMESWSLLLNSPEVRA
jgi:hypothetical protein